MARRKAAAVVTEEVGASAPAPTAPQAASEEAVVTEVAEATAPAPTEPQAEEQPAAVAEVEVVFPKVMTIHNNTPSAHAFPIAGVVIAAYRAETATFKTADQLKRFLTDARAICDLNGWVDGIVVSEGEE